MYMLYSLWIKCILLVSRWPYSWFTLIGHHSDLITCCLLLAVWHLPTVEFAASDNTPWQSQLTIPLSQLTALLLLFRHRWQKVNLVKHNWPGGKLLDFYQFILDWIAILLRQTYYLNIEKYYVCYNYCKLNSISC